MINKTKTQEKYERMIFGNSFIKPLVLKALKEQAQELLEEYSTPNIENLINGFNELRNLVHQKDKELQAQKQKFEEVWQIIDEEESSYLYGGSENKYGELGNGPVDFARIKEALTDSNHNANLNVQVAEHQIGATESAQVGSSKLKDKAPETSLNSITKDDLKEDRGSNSNVCENCGHEDYEHEEEFCRVCECEGENNYYCQKFTPRQEDKLLDGWEEPSQKEGEKK